MKRIAELNLGEAVNRAVISVPAYFMDAQRSSTIEAATIAGLKVERIVNEPTAAALAFGYQNPEKESNILIFDLGGGTFDITLLEIFDGVVEVKASAGESHLGGEDYTTALLKHILKKNDWEIDPEETNLWREKINKVFEQRPGTMTAKEIKEAIKKFQPLKIHPRDKLPNRTRLERANRLYENLNADERAELSQIINGFEAALDQQKEEDINHVISILDQYLNHYKDLV